MGLGRIDVAAGDFKKGNGNQFVHGKFHMEKPGAFFRETIPVSEVVAVELASEESVVSIGGAAGWGIAGSVLLGPAGLLAGLILGGRGKEVTFVCKFKDGRKFLGTAAESVFNQLKTAVLANSM